MLNRLKMAPQYLKGLIRHGFNAPKLASAYFGGKRSVVSYDRPSESSPTCDLSSGRGTWPVGGKAANELGLYDMSGNVWEWCWDQNSSDRRVRGGSWYLNALYCPVSFRFNHAFPDYRSNSFGFRIARSSGN
jgi:formylglycine-generating enzyme required for sulfatase activity